MCSSVGHDSIRASGLVPTAPCRELWKSIADGCSNERPAVRRVRVRYVPRAFIWERGPEGF
ncbi:MAG: hypothetical protein RL199_598 [Pseudomonadota bacterium]|jgi:hypothetical protein